LALLKHIRPNATFSCACVWCQQHRIHGEWNTARGLYV